MQDTSAFLALESTMEVVVKLQLLLRVGFCRLTHLHLSTHICVAHPSTIETARRPPAHQELVDASMGGATIECAGAVLIKTALTHGPMRYARKHNGRRVAYPKRKLGKSILYMPPNP